MSNISVRGLFLYFGAITAVAALFIFGANVFLKWAIDVEPGREAAPIDAPGPSSAAPRGAEFTPTVIYDDNIFQPDRILRDGSESIGCLVVLINRSRASLKIGISPHAVLKDPGPDYGAIAPGGKLIFDPRFVGIQKLVFHNHYHPEQEFTVEFGEKCRL